MSCTAGAERARPQKGGQHPKCSEATARQGPKLSPAANPKPAKAHCREEGSLSDPRPTTEKTTQGVTAVRERWRERYACAKMGRSSSLKVVNSCVRWWTAYYKTAVARDSGSKTFEAAVNVCTLIEYLIIVWVNVGQRW